MIIEVLLQVTGPGFAAGVVARDGRVIEAAPILRNHIKRGMTGQQVVYACYEQGWTWEKIHEVRSDPHSSG